MQTYKILTKGKEITLRSDQNMQKIKTSPAMFFFTDGEYEIHACGQLNILTTLTSHVQSLLNSWSINNG